jgi:FlaA1/EpsC-like NDP-sugar epimerase
MPPPPHGLHRYNSCQFNQKANSINSILKTTKKIAIYGAGGHGNCILNYLEKSIKSAIKLCFDKDKTKQNKYLQSSNIKITPPTTENLSSIDTILIASALYENEIVKDLRKIGFKGKILKTSTQVIFVN